LLTFFIGIFCFSGTAFAAGSSPYFTASGSTVAFSHDHSPFHLKLNLNRILVTKPSLFTMVIMSSQVKIADDSGDGRKNKGKKQGRTVQCRQSCEIHSMNEYRRRKPVR
jgi:hypothetical protein